MAGLPKLEANTRASFVGNCASRKRRCARVFMTLAKETVVAGSVSGCFRGGNEGRSQQLGAGGPSVGERGPRIAAAFCAVEGGEDFFGANSTAGAVFYRAGGSAIAGRTAAWFLKAAGRIDWSLRPTPLAATIPSGAFGAREHSSPLP